MLELTFGVHTKVASTLVVISIAPSALPQVEFVITASAVGGIQPPQSSVTVSVIVVEQF